MPQYVLRDIPVDLWARFTERAKRDGWPLRALILQLLGDFASGASEPAGAPSPFMANYAWLRPYFNEIAKRPGVLALSVSSQWMLLEERLSAPHLSFQAEALRAEPSERRPRILEWLAASAVKDSGPRIKLAMRAIAHLSDGENRRPIHYEVLGLPPGQQAFFTFFPNKGWSVLQSRDGEWTDWHGAYGSAEEALRYVETRLMLDYDPPAGTS